MLVFPFPVGSEGSRTGFLTQVSFALARSVNWGGVLRRLARPVLSAGGVLRVLYCLWRVGYGDGGGRTICPGGWTTFFILTGDVLGFRAALYFWPCVVPLFLGPFGRDLSVCVRG